MATKDTTPDLSEFHDLSTPAQAPCRIALALAREIEPKLERAEADQLAAACATPKEVITHAAISAWLAKRGIKIPWQTVGSHRRGACSCG